VKLAVGSGRRFFDSCELGNQVSPIEQAIDAFSGWFGHRCRGGVAVAPGRVNLIGEHTDYNEGFVLPIAIDRHVVTAFEAFGSGYLEIWSDYDDSKVVLDVSSLSRDDLGGWALYAAGMAWAFEQDGHVMPGARIAICADLPVGAGVSSSAAFEIALGLAFSSISGADMAGIDVARLAHRADREFVGIPSGIMDQYASAGCRQDHAMLLDCRDTSFSHCPVGPSFGFVVVDTGVARRLLSEAYAERVASCRLALEQIKRLKTGATSLRDVGLEILYEVSDQMDETTFRRARHVVTEMERPRKFVAAMADDDLEQAGALLVEGHESLAGDYGVSCRELDAAVELALAHPGCYGARLTGAGFGGSVVVLCDRASTKVVAADLGASYKEQFGKGGAYAVTASDGARVLSL
jgi:galactokinase